MKRTSLSLRWVALAALLASAALGGEEGSKADAAAEDPAWAEERKEMVALLEQYGIKDRNVLQAMRKVRRHLHLRIGRGIKARFAVSATQIVRAAFRVRGPERPANDSRYAYDSY